MLQPIKHILDAKQIVLASGSPSRRDIFEKNLQLKVEICPSLFEEDLRLEDFNSFSEYVMETAYQKVLEVENRLRGQGITPDLIIGADTMVAHENNLLGKPTNEETAFNILRRLAGDVNTVFTGVIIKTKDGKLKKFTDKSHVYFAKNLTDQQLRAYIATGEPLRMAGAYGIQGAGSTLVERIEGNYFNILGVPVFKLCEALIDLYMGPN